MRLWSRGFQVRQIGGANALVIRIRWHAKYEIWVHCSLKHAPSPIGWERVGVRGRGVLHLVDSFRELY